MSYPERDLEFPRGIKEIAYGMSSKVEFPRVTKKMLNFQGLGFWPWNFLEWSFALPGIFRGKLKK